MKSSKVINLLFSLVTTGIVSAQSCCSNTKHTGESVKITSNKEGSINDIGYRLWADGGNSSATFYSDGSFSCSFENINEYLCRSGLSFNSTKTYDQLGHLYADFKLVKQNIQNVDYSYVGVYGWSDNPLNDNFGWSENARYEFYIVDNWLGQSGPGNRVGKKNYGDFVIDGATYTVYLYESCNHCMPGESPLRQFYSIRKEPRDCGTIDITAHFKQWEELGMKLYKIHEVTILGKVQNNDIGVTGTVDFPYAKVYITGGNNPEEGEPSCSANILKQGYKCCSSNCEVVYTDKDGDWGVNNDEWCGCGTNNTPETPETPEDPENPVNTNFCSNTKHTGESVKITSKERGSINGIGYYLWADGGNNSATFYSDGSFSCSFENTLDYLCRSGLFFNSTKPHDQIGHMYADFKLDKQNIQNVDYSFVGVYGWSDNPLSDYFGWGKNAGIEFFIVDNWLSQWRPGDWVGNTKHGDFVIDGATYTLYLNEPCGFCMPGESPLRQFYSIRKEPRDCGTIDITAHIKQWEKLEMKLDKIHEVSVFGEVGSNDSGITGTVDFPYAKVYIA